MKRINFVIVVLLLFAASAAAQDTLNFRDVSRKDAVRLLAAQYDEAVKFETVVEGNFTGDLSNVEFEPALTQILGQFYGWEKAGETYVVKPITAITGTPHPDQAVANRSTSVAQAPTSPTDPYGGWHTQPAPNMGPAMAAQMAAASPTGACMKPPQPPFGHPEWSLYPEVKCGATWVCPPDVAQAGWYLWWDSQRVWIPMTPYHCGYRGPGPNYGYGNPGWNQGYGSATNYYGYSGYSGGDHGYAGYPFISGEWGLLKIDGPESKLRNVRVLVDGYDVAVASKANSAWNDPIPIRTGPHTIEFVWEGKEGVYSFERKVNIAPVMVSRGPMFLRVSPNEFENAPLTFDHERVRRVKKADGTIK